MRPVVEGMRVIQASEFQSFLNHLNSLHYKIIGPKIEGPAIVNGELKNTEELPLGWSDEQSPGKYKILNTQRSTYFHFNVTPQGWKNFLHPSKVLLFEAKQDSSGNVEFQKPKEPKQKLAFLGVRPCELSAIGIQDKVFLKNTFIDQTYKNNRDRALIIAVNCTKSSSTCFCVSMDTGPAAKNGFDISLTEVLADDEHYFVAQEGSAIGKSILEDFKEAQPVQIKKASEVVNKTAQSMSKALDTENIKDLFYQNQNHPIWDEVAERCLSCANCTMVCPTCFCTTTEDVIDLQGDNSQRWMKWDSCFNPDFSYIHGGEVRKSTSSKYRQWITHKLASWHDQFGSSGCVGCGRCIAWCPVGIDITEEAAKLRKKGTHGEM